MSELLQSGQHPDADQLSAFIEHALPAHEQEETLAHLAICPHCRNIVALSLPPAEELAKAGPAPVRRPWLSGWMMVWPAGAALAALVLAGIYIRNGLIVQSHVPPTQTAQSRPPEQAKPLPPTMTLKLQARGSAVPQAAPVPDTTTQAADRLMPVPGGGGNKLHTNQNRSVGFGRIQGSGWSSWTQSATVISGGAADQAIRTESPAVGGILAVDQAQWLLAGMACPVAFAPSPRLQMPDRWLRSTPQHPLLQQRRRSALERHNAAVAGPCGKGRVGPRLVPSRYTQWCSRRGDRQAWSAAWLERDRRPPSAAKSPTRRRVHSERIRGSHQFVDPGRPQNDDRSTGRYRVDQLDPGTYTLEAEAPGFTPREVSGLSLNPAQQSQKDLTLAVGALAQTVEVQGEAQPALAAPKVKEKISATRAAAPPVPRFEITTDTGEHWISTEMAESWHRKGRMSESSRYGQDRLRNKFFIFPASSLKTARSPVRQAAIPRPRRLARRMCMTRFCRSLPFLLTGPLVLLLAAGAFLSMRADAPSSLPLLTPTAISRSPFPITPSARAAADWSPKLLILKTMFLAGSNVLWISARATAPGSK